MIVSAPGSVSNWTGGRGKSHQSGPGKSDPYEGEVSEESSEGKIKLLIRKFYNLTFESDQFRPGSIRGDVRRNGFAVPRLSK